ncbi:hypothetical protein, partial [Actinoplanes sp. G11-F43]|uniref:hypothetical protein n=1 Tax=Actinoplanes sp. G11-F43 TaxID=3424130 RepID=UPI003D358DB1
SATTAESRTDPYNSSESLETVKPLPCKGPARLSASLDHTINPSSADGCASVLPGDPRKKKVEDWHDLLVTHDPVRHFAESGIGDKNLSNIGRLP